MEPPSGAIYRKGVPKRCEPSSTRDAANHSICCLRVELMQPAPELAVGKLLRTHTKSVVSSSLFSRSTTFTLPLCSHSQLCGPHTASFRYFACFTRTLLRAGRRTKYCGPRAADHYREPVSRELGAANGALSIESTLRDSSQHIWSRPVGTRFHDRGLTQSAIETVAPHCSGDIGAVWRPRAAAREARARSISARNAAASAAACAELAEPVFAAPPL